MQGYWDGGGRAGGGGEVNKEGGVVQGPGEEENLSRGAFGFSGFYNGRDGFEVILDLS